MKGKFKITKGEQEFQKEYLECSRKDEVKIGGVSVIVRSWRVTEVRGWHNSRNNTNDDIVLDSLEYDNKEGL